MIKILVATIFIGGLAVTPVYALDQYVMPQISQLENMYDSMDESAEEISSGTNPEQTTTFKSAESLSVQKR